LAWPDYSETTFAFLLLRELEVKHGGGLLLPTFLTQHQEAQEGGGYDASVDLSGTLHYFQFKRSEVMTHGTAHEYQAGHFTSAPLYRMHLHRKNYFWQHTALRELEAAGNSVLYAASGADSLHHLRSQFGHLAVINNSGFFLPSEIDLPNLSANHHVSFVPASPFFRVYSQEGVRGRREIPNEEAFVAFTQSRRRTSRQNRARLERFVADMPPSALPEKLSQAADDPNSLVLRAVLWAQLRYDCQLVLVAG
jgi:hypothetical protein